MKDELLKEILSELKKNVGTLERIESILSLSLLRNGFPIQEEIQLAQKEGQLSKLVDSATTIFDLLERAFEDSHERHMNLMRQRLEEYEYNWRYQGEEDWNIYLNDSENSESRKQEAEEFKSGNIKMGRMKEILYGMFSAPKNATTLNRMIISKVQHHIKEGDLPDSGIFKKIKNSQTRARGREFPSRSTLTKDEFFYFITLYRLTWGNRAKF